VASTPTNTPPRENFNAVITSPPSQLPSSIVNSNSNSSTNIISVEDIGDDNNLSNVSIPNPSSTLIRNSENKSISSHKEQEQQPSSSTSSTVTFLYELYEHEIYNPSTNTWTSRRFTQSPVTGGGGRDSTSLDPNVCSPPRNYIFNGEWKIDMSGTSGERDGFGWEYYVGRYDGLGRRRRRWVRSLLRLQHRGMTNDGGITTQQHYSAAASTKLNSSKKKQTNINPDLV
jgi:hypothetical protein